MCFLFKEKEDSVACFLLVIMLLDNCWSYLQNTEAVNRQDFVGLVYFLHLVLPFLVGLFVCGCFMTSWSPLPAPPLPLSLSSSWTVCTPCVSTLM